MHAVAALAGYTCQVQTVDIDSVDLIISASGKVHEHSVITIATAGSPAQGQPHHLNAVRSSGISPCRIKNYNDLREKRSSPSSWSCSCFPETPSQWLEISEECMISRRCAYWTSLLGMPETRNTRKVSIHLPRSHQFSVDQIQEMMRRISRGEDL